MKRIVFLVLFLLFPSTIFAEDVTNLAVNSEIDRNDSNVVNISVNIENNPGITAWTFKIEYDKEAFEYKTNSIVLSDAFSKGTLLENTDEPGKLIVSWFNFGDVDENGNLISFKLKIKEYAESGNYIFTLKCDKSDFINFNEEIIPIDTKNSNINISSKTKTNEKTLLSEHNLMLKPNETYSIKTDEKDLIWVSSDESVVIVKEGKIVPVSEGSATIEARTKDGSRQDVCFINIDQNNSSINGKIINDSILKVLIVACPILIISIVITIYLRRRKKL